MCPDISLQFDRLRLNRTSVGDEYEVGNPEKECGSVNQISRTGGKRDFSHTPGAGGRLPPDPPRTMHHDIIPAPTIFVHEGY